jgi:Flp pilus assembly protein TadG
MNKPRNSQRGSLMVESALVLLVVVVVLIGTMDVARLLFVQQSLTERVLRTWSSTIRRRYLTAEALYFNSADRWSL